MVNKVTFVGFKGGDRLNRPPLDPPLLRNLCRDFHLHFQVLWLTPLF